MGGEGRPRISVLLATSARQERRHELLRALDCIRGQASVDAVPIVVANGPNQDRQLVAAVKGMPDVRLFIVEEGSYPGALGVARRHVDTAWFSQMDDDDELMPEALISRYEAAREDGGCDAVISNGVSRSPSGDRPRWVDANVIAHDPLRALARENWLSPGAGLYRTSAITTCTFDGMPKYLEWTYIAAVLASRHRVRFLERATYVYYEQAPLSMSNSDAYVLGQPAALEAIMRLDLPGDVRDAFARRLTRARNANAVLHLRRGRRGQAWLWHVRTLLGAGGYRYLGATRHFLGHGVS
jgi:glycosyltransferase involved in cell wall biosynthesis